MRESAKRRVRYLALEALYEADTSDHDPKAVFERMLTAAASEDPKLGKPAPSTLGRDAVRGVDSLRERLDGYIQDAATKYPVSTMAVVDRNILRLAIWELVTDNSAPVAAVINEAVELAHRYGGESSPAFVNGVLRTISERIRAEAREDESGQPAALTNPTSQEN